MNIHIHTVSGKLAFLLKNHSRSAVFVLLGLGLGLSAGSQGDLQSMLLHQLQPWKQSVVDIKTVQKPSPRRESLREALRRQRLERRQSSRMRSSSGARSSSSSILRKAFIPAPIAVTPPVLQPIAQERSSAARSSVTSSLSSQAKSPVPVFEPPPVLHGAADFPAFGHAVFPFSSVPNWGDMRTPQEWNRTYTEMSREDFVPVPSYDMSRLTVPMSELTNPRNVDELTRKLFYSTHYFGAYDLDAAEFTAVHPGIDLKVALGTPVSAVAGGRVVTVKTDKALGIHVIIEHRHPTDGTFYSIYGHLGAATVDVGDDIAPGDIIGSIGMTGNTSGPHLHLQIDRGEPGETNHRPYLPAAVPSLSEADRHGINPMTFIRTYAR